MNKGLRYFLFLVFLVLLGGCGGLDQGELGNGYFYKSTSKSIVHIKTNSAQLGKKIVLGRITDYVIDEEFIVAKQIPDSMLIKTSITSDLLEEFFEKKEDGPNRDVFKDSVSNISGKVGILINKGFKGDNLDSDKKILNEVSDSILKNNPRYLEIFRNPYNYWIIDKKKNNVYGPLNKDEFKRKRKELNLNSILNL